MKRSSVALDSEIMPASEAQIPATDDGFMRGDGVFDAARIYDGRLFAFEEHLRRLERSASNIRLSFDTEMVRTDAYRLVAASARARMTSGHKSLWTLNASQPMRIFRRNS